jgi:hypothetical protein
MPRKFKYQSGDWSVPEGFVQDSGVLITRVRPGEYGVFMDGRWRLMSIEQWQARFDTPLPAGLPSGWWGVVEEVQTKAGEYTDNFSARGLQHALLLAQNQLRGAYEPKVLLRIA